ncbi:Uncharacterised protein [Mycobacteroides abscessus subsp. abscessus]|uniref:hypothetical protein n=1 Tax=Mycobacteroides abscessus TaxID=36809 RepID=UPI0009289608|nr:hypothetical protein [Mycobacteroides abscessus]SHY05938.1 Uncharacterised protein [Mycobacteroides abscessus subsp. abscessus]SIC72709.1 Uncharacterised protein [Mycobacteroides abscessus subsp. abscessus]SKP79878.1 Uncharacterised protein [Mycobacteroides abscessus subsp. abscessus]
MATQDERLAAVFIVDVEATSHTPETGVMTEFALVHLVSGASFYGHLHRNHPHPDNAAIPVVEVDDGGHVTGVYWIVDGKDIADSVTVDDRGEVASALRTWLDGFGLPRRVLVSDNNGYDAMWLNCFTDLWTGEVFFGHSSRRIGDFYAGTRQKWADHSSWKSLRRTRHTHHPLDDAHGNAEALRSLLGIEDPV